RCVRTRRLRLRARRLARAPRLPRAPGARGARARAALRRGGLRRRGRRHARRRRRRRPHAQPLLRGDLAAKPVTNAVVLAIDAGNTRVKWGVHAGDSWRASGAVATTEVDTLDTALAAAPRAAVA